MKIVGIEALPVTYRGATENPLHLLFVRVETDDGFIGYGEVTDGFGCTFPLVAEEAIRGALAPLLVGEDLTSVDRLTHKMRGWTRRRLGNQGLIIQAISGVDLALWDAYGKARGLPVSSLLGAVRDAVPVYASGGSLEDGSPASQAERFSPCLTRGVGAVKVRSGLHWQDDLRRLADLRTALGDDVRLLVDGSEHYSVPTALALARGMSHLGVFAFEEPVPQNNQPAIARLRKEAPISIAYGKHLFNAGEFLGAMQQELVDIIQPGPSISGGISEVLLAGRVAERFGIPVLPHSAGGPIALAGALHVAASLPNAALLEYCFGLDSLWSELVTAPTLGPSALTDGCLKVPDGPGLGLTVDDGFFEKHPYEADAAPRGMPTRSLGHI